MTQLLHDPTRTHIEFSGEVIASASSAEDDSLRWFEVTIYKTDSRRWVVHKVGQTRVFHRYEGGCLGRDKRPYGKVITQAVLDDDDDAFPCPTCEPVEATGDDADQLDRRFRREQPRSFVVVCDLPQGVREALEDVDRNGTRFMYRVNTRVWNDAVAADSDLIAANTVHV